MLAVKELVSIIKFHSKQEGEQPQPPAMRSESVSESFDLLKFLKDKLINLSGGKVEFDRMLLVMNNSISESFEVKNC